MKFFYELFTNYYLLSAMLSWIMAQIIKVFTGVFKLQEFSVRAMLFGTGGMPSSHTAAVCGLCLSIALGEGPRSPLVALSGVFAMIVIIDAMGVRRETGEQGKLLNTILPALKKQHDAIPSVRFKELIGHTPVQVLVGAITGVATALLLSLIPFFGIWG